MLKGYSTVKTIYKKSTLPGRTVKVWRFPTAQLGPASTPLINNYTTPGQIVALAQLLGDVSVYKMHFDFLFNYTLYILRMSSEKLQRST